MEYKILYDVKESSQSEEKMQEVVTTGLAAAKAEGGPINWDGTSNGVQNTATHTTYALGGMITYEALADNLYMKKGEPLVTSLKFSMRQTKEIVLANGYNNAFDSNYTFGDGVSMISGSHPTLSGNQSNVLASNSQLSEIAIEDLLVQVMDAKNARGLNIALMSKSLIVPTAEYFNATRILKSSLQNNTAENAINALKFNNVFPDGAKINHYLDSTKAWFIRTNCPGGLTVFNREPLGDLQQDNDFDTRNARFMAVERYSFTFGDWRTIYGSPGV